MRNAYSADFIFDELLIRNEDRCDAEVQSITDVIPNKIPSITEKLRENPEGLQCLAQQVAQQQRDQLSDKEYSRSDCAVNVSTDNLATTSSSSETSDDTCAMPYMSVGRSSPFQQITPPAAPSMDTVLAEVEGICAHMSTDQLALVMSVIQKKMSHGGSSSQSKSPKSAAGSYFTSYYGNSAPSSSSSVSSSVSRARAIPGSSSSASSASTASRAVFRSMGKGVSGPALRRNSRDRNYNSHEVSHDDDAADDTDRPGYVAPNSKMFASSRDYSIAGTSPNNRVLPLFWDNVAKTISKSHVQQVKSVKPRRSCVDSSSSVASAAAANNANSNTTFPSNAITPLDEALSQIRAQPNSQLKMSPRTAFDDRSLGSQSTASTSSGRANISRRASGDDFDGRMPTSALSRSLRASSISSLGSLDAKQQQQPTLPSSAATAPAPAPAPVPVSTPVEASIGGTVDQQIPATDFISIAAVESSEGEEPPAPHHLLLPSTARDAEPA